MNLYRKNYLPIHHSAPCGQNILQPFQCAGIFLACLFFSNLSWAVNDLIDQQKPPDPVVNYLESIERIEAVSSAYSTELADLYLGLGKSLFEREEYVEAKKAFLRGMQVLRVNFGLYDQSQTPYLFSIADIDSRLGDWRSADKVLQNVYSINYSNYREHDPGMLPVLRQMLNWYEGHLQPQTPNVNYSNLMRSEQIASKMATIIEQDQGLSHPDTTAIYRKIALHHYLMANILAEQDEAEQRSSTSASSGATAQGAEQTSINTHFIGGKTAFTKIVESVDQQQGRNSLEHAKAITVLGDWYLIFGKSHTAAKTYLQAYDVLAESEESALLIDGLFGEPIPIQFLPDQPDSSIGEQDEATGNVLEISMTITKGGKPQDIEILNRPENVTDSDLQKFKRNLRGTRFRPKLVDGVPAKAENFTWQYIIEQVEG